MSIARKCDVCGKLYEPYKIDYKNNEINGFNLSYRSAYDYNQLTKHATIDCCEECLNKIIKFIDGNKLKRSFEEEMLSEYRELMDFCSKNNITVTIRNLNTLGYEKLCSFKFEHPNWKDTSFTTIISIADIEFPTFTNKVYNINFDIITALELWIDGLKGK